MQQQTGSAVAADRSGSNVQVWDAVAAISDGMDSSSFEPMNLDDLTEEVNPEEAAALSNVAALMVKTDSISNMNIPLATNSPLTISREAMEEEMRLPELRATAMAAEDAIEECASQLLTLLTNLDMTRWSARVAAETAMLAAANAQASTLKELINLERMSLQARLQHLTQLDEMFSLREINVRDNLKAKMLQLEPLLHTSLCGGDCPDLMPQLEPPLHKLCRFLCGLLVLLFVLF